MPRGWTVNQKQSACFRIAHDPQLFPHKGKISFKSSWEFQGLIHVIFFATVQRWLTLALLLGYKKSTLFLVDSRNLL